ncbi:hypothetical protein AX17_005254 [Amanita inopinata Kibby_2008]|nr:hypothetical protein AX17_005254 [Amanita inopinata Kibby_2008]
MQDFTIHEDELEHDRILLEQNLQMQHTDYSFHLSSADGDDNAGNYEDNDVEYARHNSGPSAYPEFVPYNPRDGEQYADEETHSQLHAWSYRTGDDEEGVYPYGGETMSTAGHHASGVTLSAGLGGARRRGADVSLSGAEYDPDRPLDAMIAGVEKLSMFDTDPSKSKFSNKNITFDPLIVDSTAELDRVLQSGHNPPPPLRSRDKSSSQHSRSVRLRSPLNSFSSSTSTDDEVDRVNSDNPRPKLTDALRRVSFSPKRPRSPQTTPRGTSSHLPHGNSSGSRHMRHPSSPLARVTTNPDSPNLTQLDQTETVPTPKPTRRVASSSYPSQAPPRTVSQPQLRLQPATPSSSSLAKSVRGKSNEPKREHGTRSRSRMQEEDEDERNDGNTARPLSAPPVPRHIPHHRQATPLRKSSLKMPSGTPRFGKVHLPDVTGLTSAVESPAKMAHGDSGYMSMAALRADETAVKEVEARLIRTLNTVQSRLEHLEEENGISRRRVRELEYELEECKREVVRERTRLLEETAELSGVIQAANLSRYAQGTSGKKTAKGKGKAKDSVATIAAANLSAAEERYREAVEEKKALEALIVSLRTHLTRLTSELSEHHALLMELRSQREQDAITMREKLSEVDRLKNEVERLAGEVEVLRGVVEEGLKERRRVGREVSVDASVGQEDRGMSMDENDGLADNRRLVSDAEENSDDTDAEESRLNNNTNDDDPWSIDGSSRTNTTANPNMTAPNENDIAVGIARDRTVRTDRASLGSSIPQLGISTIDANVSALTTRSNAARANTSVERDEANSLVGEEERSRIEAEIEERRSVRGSFDVSQISLSPRPRLNSPSQSPTFQRTAAFTAARARQVENARSDDEREVDLGRETMARPPATPTSRSHIPPRAPAPTPFHGVAGADPSVPTQSQLLQEGQGRRRKTSADSQQGSAKNAGIPETPFPQIRGKYLEKLFFSAPEHDARTCAACNRHRRAHPANAHGLKGEQGLKEYQRCTGTDDEREVMIDQWLPSRHDRFVQMRRGKEREQHHAGGSGARRVETDEDDEGFAEGSLEDSRGKIAGGDRDKGKQRAVGFEQVHDMARSSGLPPQTVVTRVIRELEDDFTHYKSIYCELADQYKEMDAVSEVRRRNVLAQHIKEVVDMLEQKGDQIASLYDLLSFKDKPVSESAVPSKTGQSSSSWGRKPLWSKNPSSDR